LTVAFSVAEFCVTSDAEAVTTVGAFGGGSENSIRTSGSAK
jgi:hypothetical protein